MRLTLVAGAVSVVFAVLITGVGPAAADMPGESDESAQLVREAVALIVNTPGDMEGIEERIVDAEKAPKQEGVDLAFVRQAMAALKRENVHRARLLLERSIGAGPHLGNRDPLPIGEMRGSPGRPMAMGAESGTDVAIDALAADRNRTVGDWLALVALVALGASGVWLAARFRPRPHRHAETGP
jgi:hypothetical protein